MSDQIGRPRAVVADLPTYRPGKGAKQAEEEHGIRDAIKLASNENPDPPIGAIVDAVTEAAATLNRYADHRAVRVREAIAARVGVDPAQVTVGNGSSGVLQELCFAYVDPGDEVVFPWRSFEVYPVYTRLMAGRAVQVPLAADLGADLEAVADAVTERSKLIFLATPNNPTGVATPTDRIAQLLDRVPRDVVVCIDEAYREFVDPKFGDPVTDLLPDHPNALVTRTFSKAHGLAGLRLGYAIGHPDLIATIDKTRLPFAVNALAQSAAIAALEHADEIDRRAAAIVEERRRVETALAAAGWQLPAHQGNFVWLAVGDDADDLGLALERSGVVVRPFSGEGVRVTIGTPAENDRFLAALADVTGDAPT